MDPHTAVSSSALKNYRHQTGDGMPAVNVSTASPYKFCSDVLTALKGPEAAAGLDAFGCAEQLSQISGIPVPGQVMALRELPVRHKACCAKQGMGEAVLSAFAAP